MPHLDGRSGLTEEERILMRLSTIRHLFDDSGPWASVYLDGTGSQNDTRQLLELRWRGLRSQLIRGRADEATIEAIDSVILDSMSPIPPVLPAGQAMFAAHGRVVMTSALPAPPRRECASWSRLPHAADLVRATGEEVRWLRVDVDRTGGSITTDDGDTVTVLGPETDFITKVSTGGRAMPRYQRAAETNWDRNSGEVANAVAAVADRIDADVVVLTGDVRARQLVLDRLPAALVPCVVQVAHESTAPARDPVLAAATRHAVDTFVRARREAVVDRFHAGLASRTSVRGVAAVADAAREQRIETLLLGPDHANHLLWVDPRDATLVGMAKRDVGASEPIHEPADDAIVAAAAKANAQSVVIDADAELVEGLGAILRYAR
jgi:hypothetical protein